MIKQYSTIKTIIVDGEPRQFLDVRHAHNFEQAQLYCNHEYDEHVVGEIVKIEPFDKGEIERFN